VTYRAVLFDVGGPIDTEVLHERQCDAGMLEAVRAAGVAADDTALAEANDWAIASFAPFTYRSMIWRMCGRDSDVAAVALQHFAEASAARREARGGLELRAGIGDLLRGLHDRELLLGLAANQPAVVVDDLDRYGLGHYFRHREVSDHHGYYKPDVRLFLRACEDLDVKPAETIMVGDRIDNDIFPAKLLGMGTVLFRTGRHINQQPRGPNDVPDAEAWTVAELSAALEMLVARG
jgi:HAD superfamily hydrolase (TIGR01509 family)